MTKTPHPQSADRQGAPTAPRVLFYSHDTFGLGHLRRSRALASAITAANDDISSLILTGSPVAGRFTFPARVDHVRLPGVSKTSSGSYVSQALGMHIDDTTALRAGLIEATARNFSPDLLVVDKEPTGFRGELLPALRWLRQRGGTQIILGLRDVLDDPEVLGSEWARKGAREAVEAFYDEIWVYGVQSFYDPTWGLDLSMQLRKRMHWMGYLRREASALLPRHPLPSWPYIMVTPGGGGDGAAMVDLVLSAYESAPDLAPGAVVVYGPFLSGAQRQTFEARAKRLGDRVRTVGFEEQIETLMAGAQGVVSMGGYNTFCEILSFDKPAVIVPRTYPRKEQYLRARRAAQLGLVRFLDKTKGELTSAAMGRAIRALPGQPPPSQAFFPGLLEGLPYVSARVRTLLESPKPL
ncbi:MAG: hypothetical protein GDA40_04965 [Rhodobacteraceae bacterium]|nr:hypothetical protein [Paracoccaceae bacterium]